MHCDTLRNMAKPIGLLHEQHGYPPYWKRINGFESMCKTIIEQQVSLASAKSSYEKLRHYAGQIKPNILCKLSEDEFRLNGITKQKASYIRLLSERLIKEPDFFLSLEKLGNHEVKEKLIALKGIGHWTANVYLLVALNRINIYPDFDVALINSISYEAFENMKIDNEKAKNYIATFKPL